MKNTIVVLIVMLLGMPAFAQQDAVKVTIRSADNNIAQPLLISFLRTEKNYRGLLHSKNINQWTSKRFTDLFNPHDNGNGVTARHRTFMDVPTIYSMALPLEISRNANTLYQRSIDGSTSPSTAVTALQILGMVGGIAAGAFDPRYNNWDRNISAIDAYLQSTYYQHNK